jgi:hypothetical protein
MTKYPPLNPLRRERRMIGKQIQAQLMTVLDERTVADMLNLSQTMVNVIATEALYKIAMRMKQP